MGCVNPVKAFWMLSRLRTSDIQEVNIFPVCLDTPPSAIANSYKSVRIIAATSLRGRHRSVLVLKVLGFLEHLPELEQSLGT
jgi:hypothetical protein